MSLFPFKYQKSSQVLHKKAIKVSATNILFKTENEQQIILENFGKMINSLNIPIEIVFSSEEINPALFNLKISNPEYFEFIKQRIETKRITSKQFRVLVTSTSEEMLDTTIEVIKRYLRSCGLEYDERIEDVTNKTFIPDQMETNYVKIDGYFCRTYYVKNWPYSCTLGWMNDIYNCDINLNIGMHIHPVTKDVAIIYLNRKIAGNSSSAAIDGEENEFSDDAYDENITSALKMREELYKNDGKFFFMSYYITVKAKTLQQLERDCRYIKTILSGMDIETYSCFLSQDDGYKATNLFGIDPLDKKYNFTTEPLKYFFPFISSNIVDKDGVLVGENLLNSGLIFLNPFKYNSALMFVLGKTGGGKTYLVQLLALRLLYMGVQIDIWDYTGEEYKNLKQLTNLPNLKIHSYKTIEEYMFEMKRYVQEMRDNLHVLKPRVLLIDELWRYLDNDIISKGINEIVLTGRKHYQGLCVVTQMVDHLMKNQEVISILKQASIKALMQMEPSAAKDVQKELHLTDEEYNFLISAYQEGILFAGSRHVQFKALASREEDEIITTDPVRRAKKLYEKGGRLSAVNEEIAAGDSVKSFSVGF